MIAFSVALAGVSGGNEAQQMTVAIGVKQYNMGYGIKRVGSMKHLHQHE